MFPVPTIACSGSIHRFHRYSCFKITRMGSVILSHICTSLVADSPAYMNEQLRLWRDCAHAQARLNFCCLHTLYRLFPHYLAQFVYSISTCMIKRSVFCQTSVSSKTLGKMLLLDVWQQHKVGENAIARRLVLQKLEKIAIARRLALAKTR